MQAQKLYAICMMKEDGNSGVSGTVKFFQDGDKCTIRATFTGLSAGKHGFHIHEFGNLTEGCKTAGGHYNPHGMTHGGPSDEIRHVGDMGNVTSTGSGETTFELVDHLVNLAGPYSVVGRSCVVHADEDDLGKGGHSLSLTTGNAGARLACGVIGLSGSLE